MAADVRIPPHCVFCKVAPEDQEAYPFPLLDGRVMTRIKWAGMDRIGGQHTMDWEGAAGQIPSIVQFPTVVFMPAEAWCPACLVVMHIGRMHPVEEKALEDQKKPKLVVS